MVAPPIVRRGEVFLVGLDPARGREIKKTRPCLIVSPDEFNGHLNTLIVAPLTTGSHAYPFRMPVRFAGQQGHIVADQLRTVDRDRLVRRLGQVSPSKLERVLNILQEMFAL